MGEDPPPYTDPYLASGSETTAATAVPWPGHELPEGQAEEQADHPPHQPVRRARAHVSTATARVHSLAGWGVVGSSHLPGSQDSRYRDSSANSLLFIRQPQVAGEWRDPLTAVFSSMYSCRGRARVRGH